MKRVLTLENVGLLLGFLIVALVTFHGRATHAEHAAGAAWSMAAGAPPGSFHDRAGKATGADFSAFVATVLTSWPTSVAPRATMELAALLPFFYLAGIALLHALRTRSARHLLTRGIAHRHCCLDH